MPLPNLANELLLCISDKLESERDINTFTRTNRHLYYVLNDYLYRHNVQEFGGGSALLWAAEHGAAQRLLGEGANIQAKTDDGRTALYLAAANGHEAVVKLLLEAKADVNAKDESGQTALYHAAENGHEAVVKLLLEAKAEVNVGDKCGRTALYRAAADGHKEVVQLLLEAEADVNV